MADDRFKITAEIEDKATGPLGAIRRAMKALADDPAPLALRRNLDAVATGMRQVADGARAGLAPALAAVGVSGLSAAAGISAAVAAARGFATAAGSLSILSKETGMATTQLRAFEALGGRFGLSADAMDGAAQTFSKNFREIKKGYGDTLGWLMAQGPEGLSLAKKLRQANDPDEARRIITEFMERIPNGIERGMFAEKMFGNGALGVLGSKVLGPIKDVIADVERLLGKMPEGAEKNALAFQNQLGRLTDQFRSFRDSLGSEVLKPVNELMEQLNTALNDPKVKAEAITWVKDRIVEMRDALKGDWSESGKQLKTFLLDVATVAGATAAAIAAVVRAGQAARTYTDEQGISTPKNEAGRQARIGKLREEIEAFRAHEGQGQPGMGPKREAIDGAIRKRQDEIKKLERDAIEKGSEEGSKKGIKEGIKEVLPQIQQQSFDGGGGGGGIGSLIQRASFGGAFTARDGRGFVGGAGGGAGRAGSGRRGGSNEPAEDGPTESIPGTLNPRLAGSRKSLMNELDKDPALRRDVLKTASMENRGSPFKMQAVLESMVNRAKMNGYRSLREAIHSGFYGPVNRGRLGGALSEKDSRDGEAALAQVRAGSNAIDYRTDQGMLTDPGARRYMQEADRSGHKVVGGENYFWMGQKGRAWARQQADVDRAASRITGLVTKTERERQAEQGIINDRYADERSSRNSTGTEGAVDLGDGRIRMPDGRIRSKTYGPPNVPSSPNPVIRGMRRQREQAPAEEQASLQRRVREVGAPGIQTANMTANGAVTVRLSKDMGDVKVGTDVRGDLFNSVEVDRGRTMPMASTVA